MLILLTQQHTFINLSQQVGVREAELLMLETDNAINANQPLNDALLEIQRNMQFIPNRQADHPSTITIVDVLCMASNLLPTAAFYRTFTLSSIRDECITTGTAVLNAQYTIDHNDRTKTFLISEALNDQAAAENLDDLVASIQQFFATDPILSSETPPSTKDILCAMADVDTNLSTYDYWDLTFFRDRDCSTITADEFLDEEDKAYYARRDANRGH